MKKNIFKRNSKENRLKRVPEKRVPVT